jgi:hypothetical protein
MRGKGLRRPMCCKVGSMNTIVGDCTRSRSANALPSGNSRKAATSSCEACRIGQRRPPSRQAHSRAVIRTKKRSSRWEKGMGIYGVRMNCTKIATKSSMILRLGMNPRLAVGAVASSARRRPLTCCLAASQANVRLSPDARLARMQLPSRYTLARCPRPPGLACGSPSKVLPMPAYGWGYMLSPHGNGSE